METFSYSKINRYLKCPKNYKLHKDRDKTKKIKQSEDHTSFGKCVHSIIANYFNKELKITVCEKFSEAYTLAHKTVKRIKEKFPKFVIVGVEVNKKIKISDDIELTGIIDLIIESDNKIIEIDFKTGNWLPSYEDIKKDLQMDIYNLIKPSDQQEIWYLKHDVEYEFKKELFGGIKEKILLIIKTILEDKKFERKISPLCSVCENNDICFKNVAELTIPYLITEDDEKEFADYFSSLKVTIKKLERNLKQCKDILKCYLNGKNSKYFEYKTFKNSFFKPMEVFLLMKEKNLLNKFEKVISIKPTILKKTIGEEDYNKVVNFMEIKYPDMR